MKTQSAAAETKPLEPTAPEGSAPDAKKLSDGLNPSINARLSSAKKKATQLLVDLADKLKPSPPVLAPVDPPSLPPTPNACPTLKEDIKPPVFILLGQYEALIQMLPAFMAINQRIGMKPIVIVSHAFADIFDGVSYVEPRSITSDWYEGMNHARLTAVEVCGGVTLQSWNKGPFVDQDSSGAIILQSHGKGWFADTTKFMDVGTCMWWRAGLTTEDMMTLPLLFDRRNKEREELLLRQVNRGNQSKKPLWLYNFAGGRATFGYTPEVQQALRPLNERYYPVDVGRLRPERLFDLIGLFDASSFLATVDSFSLQLAAASNIPYAAFTEDGWFGSIPKGNCIFQSSYAMAKQNLPELTKAIVNLMPKR